MIDASTSAVVAQSQQRPPLAAAFGFAGLLPQLAVVSVLALGSTWWHFAALSMGYAYAALILSFLGGLWWGLAASQPGRTPGWVWLAAVLPSLIALASAVPWAIAEPWPGPSLVILGAALLASLLVDWQLVKIGVAPNWWMSLRFPLSIGLSVLTLAIAWLE